jgi:ADP-ribosyl-[dinitrogen reductase] hydrolase
MNFENRARGCLLGGAVGDALGGPIEFDSLATIRERFGPQGVVRMEEAFGRRGTITDDTQMTLFTAEGLVLAARAGALDRTSELARHVHRALLRWLRTQGSRSRHPTSASTDEGWLLQEARLHSRRAPGNTCLSALQGDRLGSVAHPLNQSKGCGGVMRVAPVGLALGIADPFRVACEMAAITHGHPSGYLAAGFLALAIRELVRGADLASAVGEGLEELRRWPAHEECASAVEAAMDRAGKGPVEPEAVESLGAGWVAEEALAISLYCALASPEDFSSGVLLAVNHSGDSDSTGSITGNLLGAVLGEEAIPRGWLQEVEMGSVVGRVARELVDCCGAGGDSARRTLI